MIRIVFASILLIAISVSLQDCSRVHLDSAYVHTGPCARPYGSNCDWMTRMLEAYPDSDITLTQICLPASHDAGMYLTQHCTAFANTGNTQTQYLRMANQLESGIRMFDIRPEFYKGKFYTIHSTKCDGPGCRGDDLQTILEQTNDFLNTHSELVIFNMSHYCHTSPEDPALLALIKNTIADKIYTGLVNIPASFIHRSLHEILSPGVKKGKIIFLFEGINNTNENRLRGFYDISIMPSAGGWTNDNKLPLLKQHQLENFSRYEGNGKRLYQIAWQITQHDAQAVRSAFSPNSPVAIRKKAAIANRELPIMLDSLVHKGTIRKGNIPNIIWFDMADTAMANQCIKMTKLNLE